MSKMNYSTYRTTNQSRRSPSPSTNHRSSLYHRRTSSSQQHSTSCYRSRREYSPSPSRREYSPSSSHRSSHQSTTSSHYRSPSRQRYSPTSLTHRTNSTSHHQTSQQHSSTHHHPSTSEQHSSAHHHSSSSKHLLFGHGSRLEVPSSNYRLVFVNKDMSLRVMNQILDHVAQCYLYAIDTESEMSNNELALVQIQSIGHQLPSYIIFIELNQLPGQESEMYVSVKKLFNLIFRPINKLYGWGNIHMELMSIKNLITWPISAELINIQPYYSIWYNRARILCRIPSLIDQSQDVNDVKCDRQVNVQAPCVCHPASPYKPNELWSLKNALSYASGLIIQKECTMSHWAQSLTSSNSSLSYSTQQKMIEYAKEDVMAVVFLIRPILEQWSFTMIQQRRINEAFMAFEPTKLPPLPQPNKKKKKNKNIDLGTFSRLLNGKNVDPGSSDEEIYLCQLIQPRDTTNNDDELEAAAEEHQAGSLEDETTEADIIVNVEPDEPIDEAPQQQQVQHKQVKQGRARRSAPWKKRQNKKKNDKKKKRRYRYFIKFDCYYLFPKKLVRKILRYYDIEFTHIDDDINEKLLIGLKNREAQRDARRKLSNSMFNRNGYVYYKRKFRR